MLNQTSTTSRCHEPSQSAPSKQGFQPVAPISKKAAGDLIPGSCHPMILPIADESLLTCPMDQFNAQELHGPLILLGGAPKVRPPEATVAVEEAGTPKAVQEGVSSPRVAERTLETAGTASPAQSATDKCNMLFLSFYKLIPMRRDHVCRCLSALWSGSIEWSIAVLPRATPGMTGTY